MVYTFGLIRYANIRYRNTYVYLSICELKAMLHAISVNCEVIHEILGGADFLSFSSRPLLPHEITYLSRHSSVAFLAERKDDMLRPLSFERGNYLEKDLPEILKYKGKTAANFTTMMINMAVSLTPYVSWTSPLTLFDPMCGKGTACFCALQAGFNASGLDIDRKAIHEASVFFERYLKFHMMKHSVQSRSETAGDHSLPVTEFVFANSQENYQSHNTRYLKLAVGDTADAYALFRHEKSHLIVVDLPYGIQHAPQFGKKPESFVKLLARVLPVWKQTLYPGGVIALSYNTLTLPTQKVIDLSRNAGLIPCENEGFTDLHHEIEQAVVRNVVYMLNQPLKGGN